MTIFSRPDCHLCAVVEKMARQLPPEWNLTVERIDVDTEPELQARYGNRIPVVLLDGHELCAGVFTEGELRRALSGAPKSARWRGPISRILSRLGLTPSRG